MAYPPAPKASITRRFRQILAGVTALAVVTALFFALLRWRMNAPGEHLNFGGAAADRVLYDLPTRSPEKNDE
jgi:hypothetical protein